MIKVQLSGDFEFKEKDLKKRNGTTRWSKKGRL